MITLLKKLAEREDIKWNFPGAGEDEICAYEQKLGCRLPEDYKTYLKYSNGGEFFVPGTVMWQIGGGADDKNSLENNNQAKDMELEAIPSNYLVIGRLNYGAPLCLDLDNVGNVVIWDAENEEDFLRWDSFGEWLAEELENMEM